jgi:hypothetical protein
MALNFFLDQALRKCCGRIQIAEESCRVLHYECEARLCAYGQTWRWTTNSVEVSRTTARRRYTMRQATVNGVQEAYVLTAGLSGSQMPRFKNERQLAAYINSRW